MMIRQFSLPRQNGAYQLGLELTFEPIGQIINCKHYNCSSFRFENLAKMVENIKKTKGYKLIKELNCINFELTFEEFV